MCVSVFVCLINIAGDCSDLVCLLPQNVSVRSDAVTPFPCLLLTLENCYSERIQRWHSSRPSEFPSVELILKTDALAYAQQQQ